MSEWPNPTHVDGIRGRTCKPNTRILRTRVNRRAAPGGVETRPAGNLLGALTPPDSRRLRAHLLTLIACLAFAVGCDDEATSPEADLIRDRLNDADYAQTFARAPGWESPRQPDAGGAHGPFIDIYINDVVAEALSSETALDRWPNGSLIVKDGWNDPDGEQHLFFAFMERREEGWFWGEYRGNGSLVAAGVNEPRCANCHSAGQDGVFAFELPMGVSARLMSDHPGAPWFQ